MAKTTLYVHMNGVLVGSLSQLSKGALEFEYAESWLNSELKRPISLSIPLSPNRFSGDLVYNFFDNLLPDNPDIRERIQKRYGAKTSRSFDLLSEIGADCVGALQLTNNPNPNTTKAIEAVKLSETEIASILRNYRAAPLGMNAEDDFRISIAGAQEKTALLRQGASWYRPFGTTPTTHILKLPIGMIPGRNIDLSNSVENEWLCLELLREFNIPVAQATPAQFEDQKALIVERFDRKWINNGQELIRIPQEDVCQALHVAPALKYESDGGPGVYEIMNLLVGSVTSQEDRERFLKTQFIFWLLAAPDGHAKNFSITLERRGAYRLTPLYDILSAYPLVAKKQIEQEKVTLAMAISGKNRHYRWKDIQRRHFLSTAKHCRFSETKMNYLISDTLEQLDEVIDKVSSRIPAEFPKLVAESIFAGLKKARNKMLVR